MDVCDKHAVRLRRLATGIAALAFAVAPPLASAAGNHPGHGHHGATGPTGPTGPSGPAPRGKAYGWYCRNESKQHVPGQKGTPFSQCVTAMAKLRTGKTSSPRTACAALSKKHSPGQSRTPFSRCVSAGDKLLHD